MARDALHEFVEQSAAFDLCGIGPQLGEVQLLQRLEDILEPGGQLEVLDVGGDAGLFGGQEYLVGEPRVEALQQLGLLLAECCKRFLRSVAQVP